MKDNEAKEIELTMSKPCLDDKGMISIDGNFEQVKEKILSLVDKYAGVTLTAENVPYVKGIKAMFVSLRTKIEKERRDYKKMFISPAEKMLDALCADLQQAVSKGEDVLDEQLDVFDKARRDCLTVALNGYVSEFASKYNLREEYSSMIKLLPKYYNLTQKEEDSVEDIERQAKELSAKQKEHDRSVEYIKAEAEKKGVLPESYIRSLQYRSLVDVLSDMENDSKIREEAQAKVQNGQTVTVGDELAESLKKSLALNAEEEKSERRTRLLRVTYSSDKAQVLKKFLIDNGIEYEFIKEDF